MIQKDQKRLKSQKESQIEIPKEHKKNQYKRNQYKRNYQIQFLNPKLLHLVKNLRPLKVCLLAFWFSVFLISSIKLTNRANLYMSSNKEYANLNQAIWSTQSDNKKSTTNIKSSYKSPIEINPDYLMWLSIPGTSIDYPVARNQQPGYYLNHTFMRTKNPSGCLFVQEDAPKPGNGNMVIFGHNMKDGTMFADLKRYMKPGFYKAHSSIQLHYKGKWYKAVIYSIQLRNETDLQCYETEFLLPSEKTEFIRKMKKSSMYETSYLPTSKDGLITLSTCYGSMERMIVQAALICYTND